MGERGIHRNFLDCSDIFLGFPRNSRKDSQEFLLMFPRIFLDLGSLYDFLENGGDMPRISLEFASYDFVIARIFLEFTEPDDLPRIS